MYQFLAFVCLMSALTLFRGTFGGPSPFYPGEVGRWSFFHSKERDLSGYGNNVSLIGTQSATTGIQFLTGSNKSWAEIRNANYVNGDVNDLGKYSGFSVYGLIANIGSQGPFPIVDFRAKANDYGLRIWGYPNTSIWLNLGANSTNDALRQTVGFPNMSFISGNNRYFGVSYDKASGKVVGFMNGKSQESFIDKGIRAYTNVSKIYLAHLPGDHHAFRGIMFCMMFYQMALTAAHFQSLQYYCLSSASRDGHVSVNGIGTTGANSLISGPPPSYVAYDYCNTTLDIKKGAITKETVYPNYFMKGILRTTKLTNLTPGAFYRVIVHCVFGGFKGEELTSKWFQTELDLVKKESIRIFNITSKSASVTWAPVSGEFDSFYVTINPTAGGAKAKPERVTIGTMTTLQNLSPAKSYSVQITTGLGSKRSLVSVQKQFTTPVEYLSVSGIGTTGANLYISSYGPVHADRATDYCNTTLEINKGVITKETVSPSYFMRDRSGATYLKNLTPGAIYRVTVHCVFEGFREKALTSKWFQTELDPVKTESIRIFNITSKSATVTWAAVSGKFDSFYVTINPTSGGANARPGRVTNGTVTTLQNLSPVHSYTVIITTGLGSKRSLGVVRQGFTTPDEHVSVNGIGTTRAYFSILSRGPVYDAHDHCNATLEIKKGAITKETVSPNSFLRRNPTVTRLVNLTPGAIYRVIVHCMFGNFEEEALTSKWFQTELELVKVETITIYNITSRSATVSWAAVTGIFDSFYVTINPTAGGARANPERVTRGTETTLQNLSPAHSYTVIISTGLGSKRSLGAVQKHFTTPGMPGIPVSELDPVKIESIRIFNITSKSATVTWAAVSGKFDSFYVTINPTAGGAKANPGRVTNGTVTTLQNLSPAHSYTVIITTGLGSKRSLGVVRQGFTTPDEHVSVNGIGTTRAYFSILSRGPVYGAHDHCNTTFEIKKGAITKETVSPNSFLRRNPTVTMLVNLTPGAIYRVIVHCMFGNFKEEALTSKWFQTELDLVKEETIRIFNITSESATVTWAAVSGKVDSFYVTINPTAGGAKAKPERVTSGTETTLQNLSPAHSYTVVISTGLGTKRSQGVVQRDFTTPGIPAEYPEVGPREESLVSVIALSIGCLVAFVVVVVLLVRHVRKRNGLHSETERTEAGHYEVPMTNLAYQEERQETQREHHDTTQITKFKQWLLSKKVTKATYSILEREGFQDPEMFSLLNPDSVLRLSITPLSQEVLVQGLADRCNKEGPRRFEDEIYDDVMNDAGQYAELNQT